MPLIEFDDRFPKFHLKTIGVFLGLISLVLSWLFANGVVSRMSEDPSMRFGMAFSHTFYAYLGMLCFLPIIGSIFERFIVQTKPSNPFHEPQTKLPQDSV